MNDTEKRAKLHEILDLALDVNGFECRTRKHTGNKPTVFFRLSGHACSLELDICENGWDVNDSRYNEHTALLDFGTPDFDTMISALEEQKERLENGEN